MAVCEASENMHPIGLRSMFLVRIGIGLHSIICIYMCLHTLLGFLVDPIIYHYITRDIEQEA